MAMLLWKLHLLVSSKMLSLASSVFAATLSSKFKEGLSKDGWLETSSISLPDDEVEAFTVICKAIHYRVDDIPEDLSLSCLKNLAIVCDKYDMTRSLMGWNTAWLRAGIESSAPEDFSKLLLAAYVLDIPAMFSKLSWEIIIPQAGSFVRIG